MKRPAQLSVLLLAALASLALLPFAAAAAPPATVSIEIDCAQRTLPSQRDVAQLLGIDNFDQAYAARTRLLANAQRSCKRTDAEQIILVLGPIPAQAVDARRLAGE